MPPWLGYALLVALWALAGWSVWDGLANGRVIGRYRFIRRSDTPVAFWIFFGVYLAAFALISWIIVGAVGDLTGHPISN